MSDYKTYTCKACGTDFKAHPDANAADSQTCSPRCETTAAHTLGATPSSVISKIKSILG